METVSRVIRLMMDCTTAMIGFFVKSRKGIDYLPPISDPILLQSATELADKIKNRVIKSELVVRAFIERIKAADGFVNAVVDERFNDAIAEAQAIDKQIEKGASAELLAKPFLGVPFSGKDSIAVAGLKFTCGLVCRRDEIAYEDAGVVTNLKKAGAICICITNVPEFCFWFDSDNKVHGRTNNPYDFARIPGGSTGGNGALIAYAGSVIGNAADIGGSIRYPSFFNGIFGHKPSPGIVPTTGMYPHFNEHKQTFLSAGPLCRYAADLVPMFKAMAGEEVIKSKLPDLDVPVDLKQLKVYYMLQSGARLTTAVSQDMKDTTIAAANHFKELGCDVREVNVPAFKDSFDIFVESYKDLESPMITEELTGLKGEISITKELFKSMFGRSDYTFPMLVVCIVEKLSKREITPKTIHFRDLLKRLKTEFYDMVKEDGIFLYPSFPTVAPKHKTTLMRMFDGTAHFSIFNALQVPVTQVPMGLDKERLPLGLQVVAGPLQDRLTLAAALELSRKFGGWVPPCKVLC